MNKMPRAILCVLDSAGIGGGPDAEKFGDDGSNTIGHIARACAKGEGDQAGLRSGPLKLPNLCALGLGQALNSASGFQHPSLPIDGELTGAWGCAREVSSGKDTTSGHWEIAGVPVPFDWAYFPDETPCFPEKLIAQIIDGSDINGIIGNRHASGTQIIAELGSKHIHSGKPIFYTSADSVIQIAAHEQHFGLERLYDLCRFVRELTIDMSIGRVIARPFIGDENNGFERTANRKDFSIAPPQATLLDWATSAGRHVISVGKIGDIFAHQGTGENRKAPNNERMFDTLLGAITDLDDMGLIFANFVDFDSIYGHRRDVAGYAAALEAFDRRLPELYGLMQPADLLVLTADHGCDPTWQGTDHTREQVPILAAGRQISPVGITPRMSFADIGVSVAEYLGLEAGPHGQSFLKEIC